MFFGGESFWAADSSGLCQCRPLGHHGVSDGFLFGQGEYGRIFATHPICAKDPSTLGRSKLPFNHELGCYRSNLNTVLNRTATDNTTVYHHPWDRGKSSSISSFRFRCSLRSNRDSTTIDQKGTILRSRSEHCSTPYLSPELHEASFDFHVLPRCGLGISTPNSI